MSEPKLFLKMSLEDSWGEVHGVVIQELDDQIACNGYRYPMAKLGPPDPIPFVSTFKETVERIRAKEIRRDLFHSAAQRMGKRLANYLEDKAGWHGVSRQETIREQERPATPQHRRMG